MKYFQIDLNELPKILLLGRETLIPPRVHFTRRLTEYVLYVVTRGELRLNVNSHPLTLSPGDVYLFARGDRQAPLESGFCEYYYIHFRFDQISELELDEAMYAMHLQKKQEEYLRTDAFSLKCYDYLKVLIRQNMHISDEAKFERLADMLQRNILNAGHKEPLKRFEVSAALSSFLLELEACYIPKSNPGEKKAEKTYDIARRIAAYVEHHCSDVITSEHIEQEFFLSFDHANRVFRKVMGCTIIKYRNMVRIQYAKAKMRATNMSIKEIAMELGFDNVHYFSRVFRQHEGISPSDYKRKFMRIAGSNTSGKEEKTHEKQEFRHST